MDLKRIYANLGLNATGDQEINRFNIRLQTIIDKLDNMLIVEREDEWEGNYDRTLLHKVLFNTGLVQGCTSRLSGLIKNEHKWFLNNLKITQIILDTIAKIPKKELDIKPRLSLFLKSEINKIFNLTVIDIGYKFKNGTIIKSGAEELDDKLVIEALNWLDDYPDAKKKFSNSLTHYFNKHYPDAITNAYSALEGTVKAFLDTDARLDKRETIDALLKKLSLGTYWSKIIHNYCEIAHESSSRHGKKETPIQKLRSELVEFYIYITGVFIRLISQRAPF